MAEVHLRPVTLDNYRECIRLQVEDTQAEFVAPNARSLALSKTWPSSTAPSTRCVA
jgi:diamine N-acetyltransferase